MTWAKLDDRFHEHRKVQRALRIEPAAIALYVMAITYCAGHETDGFVDDEFVCRQPMRTNTRQRATGALEEAGLWARITDGWLIHDYLEFNPSHASLSEKRARDAERKARGRRAQSDERPRGQDADSDGTPTDIHAESSGPDPYPYPTRTSGGSSGGARAAVHPALTEVLEVLNGLPDLDVVDAAIDSACRAYPDADPVAAAHVVASLVHAGHARTRSANALLMGVLKNPRQAPQPSSDAAKPRGGGKPRNKWDDALETTLTGGTP